MKAIRLPTLLACALVALALVEAGYGATEPLRVASAADWEAAAAEVRGEFREGDLIVFAPAWVGQIGRAHLGDLIPVEMAAHADIDRYRRVWEVSIRDARAPETAALSLPRRTTHGRVSVALYRHAAHEVGYDFTSHAADARVTEGGRPCFALPGGGFGCAGARVEPRTLEIDFQPRRGILVPVSAAGPVDVVFDDVALGARLTGESGVHDYYARKNSDLPIDFRVLVDDVERLHVTAHNDDGWRRFSIDTPAGRHKVTFRVHAASSRWRMLGFHAEVHE